VGVTGFRFVGVKVGVANFFCLWGA